MKRVKHVLAKKGDAVHSISPDASVYEALQEMADRDVGALVVLAGDDVIGLLSERDYARKVILKNKFSKETPLREIMSTQVVCVSLETTVESCMALMTEHRVRHLPVLEGGRLGGLISIGDVVKTIIEDLSFTIEELEHYISGNRF